MHRIFRNLKKWSILISCNTNQKNEFNYIYNKLNYLINKEKLNESIEILYLINDENISSNRKLLIEKSKSEWINFIDVNIDISNNFINEIFKNLDTDYIKFKKHFVNQNKSLIIENDYSFVIKKSLISDNYYNNNFFKPINSKILDNVLIFEKNEKKENISIIITAYESQDFIEECLNSVYNQTYFNNDNFEVLVGVDGCKKTYEKLNEIKYNYKNLKIFMMKDNKGTYITTNTLIEQTIFENIIRFDSDDTMFSTLVENVMDFKNDYDIVKIGSFDGIIYFKKSSMIDILGGYQPWFVAADSELLKRAANKLKIGNLNIKLFNRRYHTNSLTNRKDTAIGSKMRNFYSSLIKTKYNDDEIKIDRVTNEIEYDENIINYYSNKVLVIIPAYNAELTIIDSINSIKNQTYKNIEIVIVDDCSTDNTYEIIKNINNITIYRLNENVGTYKAINHGLYLSYDFDYYIIHGSDDIMEKNKIENHIKSIINTNYLASVSKYRRINYYNKDIISNPVYGDSMVLYSKIVFEKLGFYDNNRFGSDSEYFERFKKCFNNKYTYIESITNAYVIKNNLTKKIKQNIRDDYVLKFKKEHNLMISNNNFYRNNTEKNIISVNMATYPARKNSFIKVINKLLEIDIIDKIRIYLNEYDNIPSDFPINDKILYHIGEKNLKDTGKYFWSSDFKNEYYFTLDDDLIYPKSFFINHIILLKQYNNDIFVTSHGKEMVDNPSVFNEYKKLYHCLKEVNNNYWINNGGTGVMVFDNSKFIIPIDFFQYHGMADLWISLYCQKNKIPILCRKHKKDELIYIEQKETLYDRRYDMKKQHKMILNSIETWKLYKK